MIERLHYRQRCVVRVLVERIAPYKGRVYAPCCGSAGMFVQSETFVEQHGQRIGDIAVFVLANGSMSSNQSGEGEIRKAIIEPTLVHRMVARSSQLYYNTQIAV